MGMCGQPVFSSLRFCLLPHLRAPFSMLDAESVGVLLFRG